MAGVPVRLPLLQLPPLQIPLPPPPVQAQLNVVHILQPHNLLQQNHQGPPQITGSLIDPSNFKVFADLQGKSACVTLLQHNGPWVQLPNEFVESVYRATNSIDVQELILKNHTLTTLPQNLSTLSSITLLDLSYNNFEAVPTSVCQLHQLRQLYLQHNKISAIPDSLGQLGNLRVIYLQYNSLSELPLGVCRCKSLQVLHIENNKIETLPEELGKLRNLKQLHATSNTIKALPLSAQKLCHLEELYLSNNSIKQLNEISSLSSLKQLHLANNKLQFLPSCIIHMDQIQGLTLTGNDMKFPPLSACRGGIKRIQQYMLHKIETSFVDYGDGDSITTNLYYTGSDYNLETASDSPCEDID